MKKIVLVIIAIMVWGLGIASAIIILINELRLNNSLFGSWVYFPEGATTLAIFSAILQIVIVSALGLIILLFGLKCKKGKSEKN